MLPLDAFAHVLLLFLLQHDLDEQLLQFLVAVVDAELLETAHQRTHQQAHFPHVICSLFPPASHGLVESNGSLPPGS